MELAREERLVNWLVIDVVQPTYLSTMTSLGALMPRLACACKHGFCSSVGLLLTRMTTFGVGGAGTAFGLEATQCNSLFQG